MRVLSERPRAYPPELDSDFGAQAGLCAETAPGSGAFVREFARATVKMDCVSWTPTITCTMEVIGRNAQECTRGAHGSRSL